MLFFGFGGAIPPIALGQIAREAMMRARHRLRSAGTNGKTILGGILIVSGRVRRDHPRPLPLPLVFHINHAESVLPMRDGQPKLRDFPAGFGGSGEAIAE
jgi:hypothetical protein